MKTLTAKAGTLRRDSDGNVIPGQETPSARVQSSGGGGGPGTADPITELLLSILGKSGLAGIPGLQDIAQGQTNSINSRVSPGGVHGLGGNLAEGLGGLDQGSAYRPTSGGGGHAAFAGKEAYRESPENAIGMQSKLTDQEDERRRRLAKEMLDDRMDAYERIFSKFGGQTGKATTTTNQGGEYQNIGGRPEWFPTSSSQKTQESGFDIRDLMSMF